MLKGAIELPFKNMRRVFCELLPLLGEGELVGTAVRRIWNEPNQLVPLQGGEHAADGRFGKPMVLRNGALIELGPVQHRDEYAKLRKRQAAHGAKALLSSPAHEAGEFVDSYANVFGEVRHHAQVTYTSIVYMSSV